MDRNASTERHVLWQKMCLPFGEASKLTVVQMFALEERSYWTALSLRSLGESAVVSQPLQKSFLLVHIFTHSTIIFQGPIMCQALC